MITIILIRTKKTTRRCSAEAHVFCADRTTTRDFGDKKKREEKKERFLEVGLNTLNQSASNFSR